MKNTELLSEFTNLYPLSKTLRFELIPQGKTLEYIKENKVLEKDEKIKNAYLALKPILDEIHETVINDSLGSTNAKEIQFSDYFETYKAKVTNRKAKSADENETKNELKSEEKGLREKIGQTFQIGVDKFKKKYKNIEFKKDNIECLAEKKILEYIEGNLENLFLDKEERETFKNHLKVFSNFFGYFSKFNTNRMNYYDTQEEKSTAIATRIVHENLPRVCDNIMQFEKKQDDYTKMLSSLQKKGITTQIKDAKTGQMIDAKSVEGSMFDIAKYSSCLCQTGIEEYNEVMGHYNSLINLFNQQAKRNPGKENGSKLAQFKTLHKQIGCGKREDLFFALKYDTQEEQNKKNDKEAEILNLQSLLTKIKDSGKKYFTENEDSVNVYTFTNWLKEQESWDGIYWAKSAVDKISNKYLENWFVLKEKLKTNKEKSCVSYNKKTDEIEINDAFELSGLFEILDKRENGSEEIFLKESSSYVKPNVSDVKPSKKLINFICSDIEKEMEAFFEKMKAVQCLTDYKKDENKLLIKECLDSMLSVIRMLKYFLVSERKIKGNPINAELSNMLSALVFAEDINWSQCYDAIRNYLTKTPQEDVTQNKLKLNFDKSNLLEGFVDSQTSSDNGTQYGGYIFRKLNNSCNEYEYFLGISAKAKLFRPKKEEYKDKSGYERLNYYQLNSKKNHCKYEGFDEDKKAIVKCTLALVEAAAKDDDTLDSASKKIQAYGEKAYGEKKDMTLNGLFGKIQKEDNLKDLLNNTELMSQVNTMIGKINEELKKDKIKIKAIRDFFNQEHQYLGIEGLSQITKDLQNLIKKEKQFDFICVEKKEFEENLEKKDQPLYLFKISNKDLSYVDTFAKGNRKKRKEDNKENLHTLFFKGLMREGCFNNNSIFDIGKGEIFFRKKAIPYTEDELKKGHHCAELKDKFKYPIISNKRFASDKYHLHLSISLNYAAEGKTDVNLLVRDHFVKSENLRFLGIDRGENHLIYYSLIDKEAKILAQGSFNEIGKKNYYKPIVDLVEKRRSKREKWGEMDQIKNLKDGYISLVVHEIVEKMKVDNKYTPTYIVLEDLNVGFKRSRQKIEQEVYQKFEIALAKKLNYLVDKSVKIGEVASATKALQLTPEVTTYQDNIENKKQVGIMLYTRANYTSVTDSLTGWRKSAYIKRGTEKEIETQIEECFTEIAFDGKDYYFKYKEKQKEWTLWSSNQGEEFPRYRGVRGNAKGEWTVQSFEIKSMLDKIFESYDKEKSLLKQMKDGKELTKFKSEYTAWESLRCAIDLIQQIRNSGDPKQNQDENFLYSPVRNEEGTHYDSRDYEKQENPVLPKDADANGAYNIARKGLIMNAHIEQWIKDGKKDKKDKRGSDLDLFVSDEEWDLWLSSKDEWLKKLGVYASQTEMEKHRSSINGVAKIQGTKRQRVATICTE